MNGAICREAAHPRISGLAGRTLLDAVGNDAKHDDDGGDQPRHRSDVLPRVSDVVVSAATVLALLSVREEGHYDYHVDKLNAQYCPRLPVNFSEIQKAISQETGKFIDAAPKSTIVFMVEGICRRFRLEAPCKPLLDALTASDGQAK